MSDERNGWRIASPAVLSLVALLITFLFGQGYAPNANGFVIYGWVILGAVVGAIIGFVLSVIAEAHRG